MQRFWEKVDRSNGCWEWTAAKNWLGYGVFRLDGRQKKAHRVAYELTSGVISDGLDIHHVCHNRGCVNPAHLEAITHAENIQRRKYWKELCVRGHPLADAPVIPGAGGGRRICRPCGVINARAYRERQALK